MSTCLEIQPWYSVTVFTGLCHVLCCFNMLQCIQARDTFTTRTEFLEKHPPWSAMPGPYPAVGRCLARRIQDDKHGSTLKYRVTRAVHKKCMVSFKPRAGKVVHQQPYTQFARYLGTTQQEAQLVSNLHFKVRATTDMQVCRMIGPDQSWHDIRPVGRDL